MSAPSPPAPSSDAPPPPGPTAGREKRRWMPGAPMTSAATTGVFVLAILAALYFGRDFLMPIVLAITISLMLLPVVRALRRCHVPEYLGAALVVGGVLTLLTAATIWSYAPAMEWAERAPRTLGKVALKLGDLRQHVENVGRAAAEVEKLTASDEEEAPEVQIQEEDVPTTVVRFTVDFIVGVVIVVVLVYFLLATRARFLHKAFALVIPPPGEGGGPSVVADTEQNVSRYLFTITSINFALGMVVGAAMWAWGMPNPILWGAMAALFNFVPYLGAIAGVAITTLVAVVTFEDLRWAAVPLSYVLVNSLEGMVITPSILGRRFALDPLVVFVWLIFWGWLWGIGGALLAMPMLVIVRIISERTSRHAAINGLLSNKDPAPPLDAGAKRGANAF